MLRRSSLTMPIATPLTSAVSTSNTQALGPTHRVRIRCCGQQKGSSVCETAGGRRPSARQGPGRPRNRTAHGPTRESRLGHIDRQRLTRTQRPVEAASRQDNPRPGVTWGCLHGVATGSESRPGLHRLSTRPNAVPAMALPAKPAQPSAWCKDAPAGATRSPWTKRSQSGTRLAGARSGSRHDRVGPSLGPQRGNCTPPEQRARSDDEPPGGVARVNPTAQALDAPGTA
jgi:hypothetical protein